MTKSALRLGFAGTPQLAAMVLLYLLEHTGYKIDIVYTQPDRPAGRGRKIIYSPVKQLAIEHQLHFAQPDTPDYMDTAYNLDQLDVLVVVAYGMILPADLLHRPKNGCINIHTSLLPRWRGAAPIQRAIQAGDTETGITIIQMDEGLDSGSIIGQKKCPITSDETSGSLHNKLAQLAVPCLIEVLENIQSGTVKPVIQDPALATYARKISKSEAKIDWSRPAIEIERTIRAFNPAPVAYAEFNGMSFRLWEARVLDKTVSSVPGTIVNFNEQGIDVATGDRLLRLLKIQPAGKKAMTIKEFYNGRPDFFVCQKPTET